MPRGLDHVVHAVGDLEGAAELYRRLGFTVGARNRHSWGTHNHVVQLPGFFIELLTVAEPEKLGSDGFSNLFGRFNQSFLVKPGRAVAAAAGERRCRGRCRGLAIGGHCCLGSDEVRARGQTA